jgi:hypothetical protein
MKLFLDLDGVIRWLTHDLRGGISPQTWTEPLPDGRCMLQAINDDLNYLITAPATPYYEVIKTLQEINIITHPQPGWEENTTKWIYNHFPNHKVSITFVNAPEEKLLLLKPDDLLIEDYPFFTDYSQIVLIDWPYNRNVDSAVVRITEPEQLGDLFRELKLKGEN